MTQIVISIEMTIQDGNNNFTLDLVKDSQGDDITDEFVSYCNANSLPTGSQTEIENAAVEFSKNNSNGLP